MNIYVGNLAYSATEEALQAEFEAYGAVTSAKIVVDRFSGQSRGFGFVEMPNKEEAENAIRNLNGKEMGGRALRINESRPKTEFSGGGRGPGGGAGGGRGNFEGRKRY